MAADLPLHVGLVASPDTEGFRDFMGQIRGSGFAFRVQVVAVPVQGPSAPRAVARGVTALGASGCDLVVVVRGGGSKGDLSTFDSEAVARAVAGAPVAVWTGIGHTGDQSVADIVANRAWVTPTECGQEVVRRVGEWWDSVAARGAVVARRSRGVVDEAARRDGQARSRLAACTRGQIQRHADRLAHRAARIAALAPRCCDDVQRTIMSRAGRLGPLTTATLDRHADAAESMRRLLSAYDVDRQLERGYTITYDDAGRVVRSAAGLSAGAVLETRFADGRRRSTVDERNGDPPPTPSSPGTPIPGTET